MYETTIKPPITPAITPDAAALSTSQTQNNALYSKVTWRLIPLLCVCYIASYLDKINVGFAKLQMQSDLGFSETIYGLGAGLFFVGYMLFEVPSNLILQRVGARGWIARIMVTWGVISGCMMFVQTPMQFYILRFLLGVAEAGFYPGVMLYITFWYPTYRRGKIMALFLLAIPLASVIGGPISGWIMTAFDGVNNMPGWQWLFFLEAIPSVLLGIFVLMWLPSNIKSAKWLTDKEKMLLTEELARDKLEEFSSSVREAFANMRVWLLGVVDALLMLGVYGLNFWLPTLIRESGVESDFHIGLLAGLSSALAVGALLLNGMSSDKHRERRWHIAVPAFIAALAMGLSPFYSLNPIMVVILLSVANLALMATFPVFWCIPPTFLKGRAAAAGIALIASMSTLGGVGATYIMGVLKDVTHSSAAGLFMFAGSLLVAGFLILLLPKKVVNL